MTSAVDTVYVNNPWLQQMGPSVYNLLVALVQQAADANTIVATIRSTDEYKERFAGLIARQSKGLAAINEAEYLGIEDSYRRQLENAGVYQTLFPNLEAFREFAAQQIGFDVSPQEMSVRIDRGYAAVSDARPEIEAMFSTFYGVTPTPNAMLAYFLDPERGTNEIENQIAAATVGGEALAYGLNITRTRAELLSAQGVTQQMARQGFADIAREQPQLEKLAALTQFTPIGQTDLENFFFHQDPEVMAQRQRIFDTALSSFRSTSVRQSTAEGGVTELFDRRRTV